MRTSGKISAAIEILADFDARRVPLKSAIADWARNARYAGAKDRAWISGLCLDALRRRRSLAAAMGDEAPRAAILGAMRFLWRTPPSELATLAAETPHGPGALTDGENARLADADWTAFFERRDAASRTPSDGGAATRPLELAPSVAGDFPAWLEPLMARAFGDRAADEGAALSARADIDLRINKLKASPEKAAAALKSVGARAEPLLTTAARISAPPAHERAPAVTIFPAFNKGWFEVQDLGSQIAAAAAGSIKGAQALDFCAGGGGKTLALAALMENTGQLYAFDSDARRLQPLYERARRAGVRNLQVRNPAGDERLADLAEKMDVVFIDAPCTGSGTWRRHPDTKWRLTQEQLHRRVAEQDAALAAAAPFVRPGGRLVYATCSIFMEENEDRLAHFGAAHPQFEPIDALDQIAASGILTPAGRTALAACRTPEGALRLTPARVGADGFFIAVLRRA